MTQRILSMSHEEVAREIILGRNTALVPQNAEYLIQQISEALQDRFDLGFKAAGGTIHDLRIHGEALK